VLCVCTGLYRPRGLLLSAWRAAGRRAGSAPACPTASCPRTPHPAPKQVHAAIRTNPVHEKKARSKPAGAKRWQPAKSTYEERKERLKQKLAMLAEGDDE
jgi:hypothetical protein